MKLSFVNLLATATVTASTEDAAYPATNLRTPQSRYLPAKTTVATDSWWLVDFGAPVALDVIALVRANVATVRAQGNATDTWGSPSYNELVTIAANPLTGQYQHGLLPSGTGTPFNYRYLRLFVPTQAPVEAPPTSAFRLGGVWAGVLVAPPSKFSLDFDHEIVFPGRDVPMGSGARQHLSLGERYVRLRRKRTARFTWATPYLADDARAWAVIDGAAEAADVFLVIEDLGHPSMTWVVRRVGDAVTWVVTPPGVVETDWPLEEVVGP